MTNQRKTFVGTGCSSGLGFEAIRQLLGKLPPLSLDIDFSTVVLGVRDTATTAAAFAGAEVATPVPTLLPLQLNDVSSVKSFATETLAILGEAPLDYLFLNAASGYTVDHKSKYGDWCEQYIVNVISQHYLIHLLREKLVASKTRIVIVSSGFIRTVNDATSSVLESQLKGVPGPTYLENPYAQSKFVQLLNAHYWRRTLASTGCVVVAVTPGIVPTTGLTRRANFSVPHDAPGARSLDAGAATLLDAFVRNDFPEDPNRIFLSFAGTWDEADSAVLAKSLDRGQQDEWSPSKEKIEALFA
ncbi:hypothetical protein HMN09_00984000 [Mycena chlorophos]|uniref:Uncharacterized protein n=1 Tax=Mycena chlorophos TaxID=658473 RepID=A0A8H6SHK2_MYCCL|nr:hypothetical protein HMN09_00984000 [Mycena chlorophos]